MGRHSSPATPWRQRVRFIEDSRVHRPAVNRRLVPFVATYESGVRRGAGARCLGLRIPPMPITSSSKPITLEERRSIGGPVFQRGRGKAKGLGRPLRRDFRGSGGWFGSEGGPLIPDSGDSEGSGGSRWTLGRSYGPHRAVFPTFRPHSQREDALPEACYSPVFRRDHAWLGAV